MRGGPDSQSAGTYTGRDGSRIGQRLHGVLTHLSHPAHTLDNPETMASTKLPTFDELPPFKDFTGCAWEVWGKDDQLGTVNLLTEEVVKEASKEIKYVHSPYRPSSLLHSGCR